MLVEVVVVLKQLPCSIHVKEDIVDPALTYAAHLIVLPYYEDCCFLLRWFALPGFGNAYFRNHSNSLFLLLNFVAEHLQHSLPTSDIWG